MDYTDLKQRLIDNYHSKGLSNCIGSVEKVVDELFEGLEEEQIENDEPLFTEEDIKNAFEATEPKFTEDEITKIVDNLPPLFTEDEIKKSFDSEVD